jgi:ABC-type amino acid transport substrate-binding protein
MFRYHRVFVALLVLALLMSACKDKDDKKKTDDSPADLDAGLVDVVFNDYNNTLIYIQTHPNIRLQGDIFEPAGLGIAVQTGDTNLKQSGEVARLFNKWIVG